MIKALQETVDVTVAIVNWNTRDELRECIASALRHYRDFTYEIVVVDNASADGSAEMVRREFPEVRLIENRENAGFAVANNQIMREAKGRHILLLNSDTITVDNSVKLLIDYADQHPRAGIVGGRLLNRDGSFQASHARFPSLWTEFLLTTGLGKRFIQPSYPSYGEVEEPCQADWVGGAFLLARSEAIDEVGMLDEAFFMYSEETDWCYRMKKKGWEVHHLPPAKVVHLLGASSAKSEEPLLRRLVLSRVKFYSKHNNALLSMVYRAFLASAHLVKAAIWQVRCLLGRGSKADEARRLSRLNLNIAKLAMGWNS